MPFNISNNTVIDSAHPRGIGVYRLYSPINPPPASTAKPVEFLYISDSTGGGDWGGRVGHLRIGDLTFLEKNQGEHKTNTNTRDWPFRDTYNVVSTACTSYRPDDTRWPEGIRDSREGLDLWNSEHMLLWARTGKDSINNSFYIVFSSGSLEHS